MAGNLGEISEDELISGINITPLVDVVLVLLIIFMITAPSIYQSTIKIQLPKAKTTSQTNESHLHFLINSEGQLFWNKTSMDWKTLKNQLKELAQPSQKTAIISADEKAYHGTVIRLIDALQEVGLSQFSLQVESVSSR